MSGSNIINANLDRWAAQKMAGVQGVGTIIASEAAAKAKAEAPWQPIYKPPKPMKYSGNARQGLFGKFRWEGLRGIISLGHKVDYGVYLELANDGRFAILEKTLNSLRQKFFNRVKQIMGA